MAKKITQQQTYDNRVKVIDWLLNPKLRKAREALRDSKGGRCCLGHMCDALDVTHTRVKSWDGHVEHFYGDEKEGALAPLDLINSVGFFDRHGSTSNGQYIMGSDYDNLAEVNDQTRNSPQTIGAYLKTVIMGGPNTPWTKLNPKNVKQI